MISKDYVGYIEGTDVSKVQPNYLVYPSKNVIIHKGTAYTRPGITNDGNTPTGETKIIGERVWKDALGGEKALRVTQDGRVQLKYLGIWITIYTGVDPDAVRVRFDTWIDDSGAIVKKRIFFVDGSDVMFEWNGAVGVIASVFANGIQTISSATNDTQDSGGIDYAVGDILTVSGGGANAQIKVDTIQAGAIRTNALNSGGSGYAANDILTINGGTHLAFLKVLTVDGSGIILTYQLISRGWGYGAGGSAKTTNAVTGLGTGATINVGSDTGNTISSWELISRGTGYSTATLVALTGGSGTGASVDITAVSNGISISGNLTPLKLGFDDGSGNGGNPVEIIRFSSPGVVEDTTLYTQTDDGSLATMTLSGSVSPTPNVGDIILGQVIKHTDVLAGIDKDEIYTYKNHIAVANLNSITVYFSDAEEKLDFTIPASDDRTALSAFLVNLDQNFTAMISRFDAALKESVLWISSVDDWLKIIALDAADSNGEWVDTQQVAEAERTGALPFCVAQQKGDIIFFAQDRTLQRITTVDVLAKDTLQLLSDEVETLLPRLNAEEARIYYLKRYIYIVFPAEAIVVALDVVENHFQPPWTLPVQLMSVIDGVLMGHSNSRDETFSMLTGSSDLGTDIESIFAFGYYQGYQRVSRTTHVTQDFFQKQHNDFAISGRLTPTTKVLVEPFFETDGARGIDPYNFLGSAIKAYDVPDDEGWATHLWAGSSYGGADDPANPLRRFYAWRKMEASPWFEFSAKITVTGKDQEFHLLSWYIDDSLSDDVVPDDLYIAR